MKTYIFEVPATYRYEISADSEEKAREILIEDGGLSAMGDLCEMDYRDYEQAPCVDVEDRYYDEEKKEWVDND